MPTFVPFKALNADMPNGVHNLATATLKVALCNAANAPDEDTDGQLSDLTTVSLTNLDSDVITTTSSILDSGVWELILADKVLLASGGAIPTWRYAVIYNDDATNDELIGYVDNGSDLDLADGEQVTLDFDAANGVVRLAVA